MLAYRLNCSPPFARWNNTHNLFIVLFTERFLLLQLVQIAYDKTDTKAVREFTSARCIITHGGCCLLLLLAHHFYLSNSSPCSFRHGVYPRKTKSFAYQSRTVRHRIWNFRLPRIVKLYLKPALNEKFRFFPLTLNSTVFIEYHKHTQYTFVYPSSLGPVPNVRLRTDYPYLTTLNTGSAQRSPVVKFSCHRTMCGAKVPFTHNIFLHDINDCGNDRIIAANQTSLFSFKHVFLFTKNLQTICFAVCFVQVFCVNVRPFHIGREHSATAIANMNLTTILIGAVARNLETSVLNTFCNLHVFGET